MVAPLETLRFHQIANLRPERKLRLTMAADAIRLKNINQGQNMQAQATGTAIFISVLMLASLGNAVAQRATPTPRAGPTPPPRNFQAGAVYVLTNQVDNTVAVFNRDASGMLTSAGEFSTGGAGDPVPQGTDPATDPLASQGALILDQGHQFLYAVNAGSNQISVLQITPSGLDLVDVVDSGGVRPISLTVNQIEAAWCYLQNRNLI